MNYIFGYGSLMSKYSRQHHSNILSPAIPATLDGWVRAWCTVYPDEGATYAGAYRDCTRQLDGVLIPSEIDDSLSERERGYQFLRVSIDELSWGSEGSEGQKLSTSDNVWICETLTPGAATTANPLPQSYIDTCLSGCMESQGIEGAKRFITQTIGWNSIWTNDRLSSRLPIYPRYAPVSAAQVQLIDSLLEQAGVLKFRSPISLKAK